MSIIGLKRIRVSGLACARALSRISSAKLRILHVKKTDEISMEMTVFARDEAKIRELLGNGYRIQVISKKGIGFKVKRLKKRKVLLFGLLLCVLALTVLSQRTFFVSVSGSENEQIKQIVRDCGLLAWHKDIPDKIASANEKILDLDGIIWSSISADGCFIKVFVKEEENTPGEQTGGRIVASKDCRIKNLIVYSGTAMKNNGDTVFAGEELISGIETAGDQTREVPARGKAIAEVWYYATECIFKEEEKISLTGRKDTYFVFELFGKNFTLFKNNDFAETVDNVSNFGIFKRIVSRETERSTVSVDVLKRCAQTEKNLKLKLAFDVPQGTEILDRQTYIEERDDCLLVSVSALTVEDVAIYN